MSRSFQAEVTENKEINKDVHCLTIKPLLSGMTPEPGQFYMLETSDTFDPLLKRPFCIFKSESEELSFLIRKVGRGTEMINKKAVGCRINVLGPLGTPYPVIKNDPVIIAGGMGIASLYPLIKRFSGRATVLYGAAGRDDLVFVEEIRSYARSFFIATDDGSEGVKGTVVDLLLDQVESGDNVTMYACGPGIMLQRVASFSRESKISCFVSLEQTMACGIGSCLGCVVKTVRGHERVCKEGPVFSAADLIFE